MQLIISEVVQATCFHWSTRPGYVSYVLKNVKLPNREDQFISLLESPTASGLTESGFESQTEHQAFHPNDSRIGCHRLSPPWFTDMPKALTVCLHLHLPGPVGQTGKSCIADDLDGEDSLTLGRIGCSRIGGS